MYVLIGLHLLMIFDSLICSWANGVASSTFNFYAGISREEFPPEVPKWKWLEKTLEGVRSGVITPETIKDDLINGVLKVRTVLLSP